METQVFISFTPSSHLGGGKTKRAIQIVHIDGRMYAILGPSGFFYVTYSECRDSANDWISHIRKQSGKTRFKEIIIQPHWVRKGTLDEIWICMYPEDIQAFLNEFRLKFKIIT